LGLRLTRAATLTALVSAFLATSLTGCDLTTESAETGEIIIGADLELSGSGAVIGKAYHDALRLKVEQLNAAGAAGNRKIALSVRDNRSDSILAVKNVAEFGDSPDVAAIITGTCSQCLLAASRTINDKRLPTVALAPATRVSNPVTDRRYIFKLGPNAGDSAAALAGELERADVRKVGLLITNDPYGADGAAAMKAELAKTSPQIKLVETQTVKTTDTDLSGAIGALLAEKPDALVVWAFAEQAELAATIAKGLGFDGRLFFDAAAAGDLFLSGPAATAAEGTTMVFTQTMVIDDVIATTPAKATRKQWFRDYTARYGSYFGYASFAADALQLIADAVSRVGDTDRERIRNVLETSQLDGLSGPIRITPDNHSGLMPQALTMLVARSGRWRLAS
jgi:branched-chain amino acid transport system substrate-binding protein